VLVGLPGVPDRAPGGFKVHGLAGSTGIQPQDRDRC
jgi:hypothetical protein